MAYVLTFLAGIVFTIIGWSLCAAAGREEERRERAERIALAERLLAESERKES